MATMTKAEEAVILLQQGFGCAQVVFSVFAPDFGIDRDTALRISEGFSAGMSSTDNICGALSGAIMVIGLRYGSQWLMTSKRKIRPSRRSLSFYRSLKSSTTR